MSRSTAGFDYLRLALASGVLVFHSYALTFPQAAATPPLIRGAGALMVPMFFVVSGFLVAGSVERHSLPVYAGLRALRIFPGLAASVVTTLLALSLLSTAPDYFSNPQTLVFLVNLFGISAGSLPGVFLDNPFRGLVNGSLWTIGYELTCYWILGIVALLGLRRRAFVLVGALAVLAMSTVAHWNDGWAPAVTWPMLIAEFFLGTSLYLYRDRVRISTPLALGALALAYALNSLGMMPVALLPGAYAAVGLGTVAARRLRNDYSYGIYVAAFPIQQALIQLGVDHWLANVAVAGPLTVAYAVISWHLIEKPALSLRARALRRPPPVAVTA